MQDESFATMQPTEAMVQHLEELRASTSTINAPVLNMHECHLEKPSPSEEHLEIFQGHQVVKDI